MGPVHANPIINSQPTGSPVHANPIGDSRPPGGTTQPTGQRPVGLQNQGGGPIKNCAGGSNQSYANCTRLCTKLYPPGKDIFQGKDTRQRCLNRCDHKYFCLPQ
jgi:hypothetical protein